MSNRGSELLARNVTGDGNTPVLLLHGLGANCRQPLNLIDLSAGLTYIAPDLRAHGDTDLSEESANLTFDRLAADVEELVTHLIPDGRPVQVMGISMGAGVALQLLHRSNLDIRTTLLVRPAWQLTPNPPNLAVFGDVAALLTTTTPDEGKQLLQRRTAYQAIRAVSELAALSTLAQFDDLRATQRAHRLVAIPGSCPLVPSAPSRNVIHVVGCAQDPMHPMPLAAGLADALGAQLHAVAPRYDRPLEHRAEVNAIFRDVVKQT